MTGRHRRTQFSPARRALLGTVPLLGGAGVAAAGVLGGAVPGDDPPETPIPELPVAAGTAASSEVTAASDAELLEQGTGTQGPAAGTGGAQPRGSAATPLGAAAAPQGSAGVSSGSAAVAQGAVPETETPAVEPPATPVLRGLPGHGESAMEVVAGARDAAEAHSAADDRAAAQVGTVADELRAQAEQRAEDARAAGDAALAAYHEAEAERQAERPSRPVMIAPQRPADAVADPGASCDSSELLRLGPLAVAGPDDPDCALDPWIADQLANERDR
ncbi:hypothetical protein WIS52_01995 [Pseudonocardia nematodicida]|uniref:Uncharacterized protein n=1 Tax=Pseudonocardia nematodicida TaxID=1206997 RepID=A0ABV1K5V0_9PSEU